MSFLSSFHKTLSCVYLASLVAGCASTPSNETQQALDLVNELTLKNDLTDSRYQNIDGYAHLKVNLALRHQMAQYAQQPDLDAKKAFVSQILKQAQNNGSDAMQLYFARMNNSQLRQLLEDNPDWKKSFFQQNTLSIRHFLQQEYQANAEAALAQNLKDIQSFNHEAQIDAYWSDFTGQIEESIMTEGRLTRQILTAPFVPIIKSWIAYHEMIDYRGAKDASFDQAQVYAPMLNANVPLGISDSDWALLQRHAPFIVQQTDHQGDYPESSNHFGTLRLTSNQQDEIMPVVDITHPALYAYTDEKIIQGIKTKQLVYTFWYTEHPRFNLIDFEAGPLEGWTIRISLNQNNEPLLFESVSNCGCYYKVFPTDRIEAMSAQTYSDKLPEKNFYIENHLDDQYDAIVPELVSGMNTQPQNIALYYSSGRHQLITISNRDQINASWMENPKTYQLRAYAELENLPFQGRNVSLFGTDGLVRGAHRLESTVLTPSGLYHAGHPRQRETQMIYFDDAQFDDPSLLETYLRLPPQAFASQPEGIQ